MSRKKAVFLYEGKRMRWFALAGIIAGVLFTILMMHEFKGAFEDGSFYLGGGINFGFCKMLGSASILIVGCIAVMSIFQFYIRLPIQSLYIWVVLQNHSFFPANAGYEK